MKRRGPRPFHAPAGAISIERDQSQVSYCSAECQKVHWKEGGHKTHCDALKEMGVLAEAMATAKKKARAGDGCWYHFPMSVARGDTPVGIGETPSAATSHAAAVFVPTGECECGACIICLESDPPPIQSGCACRGDAGLAHVECRVMAALHKQNSANSMDGWQECPTCEQLFSGRMGIGLAEELRRRSLEVFDTPMGVKDWAFASSLLAGMLMASGMDLESETVCRETMKRIYDEKIVLEDADIIIVNLLENFSVALDNQGKHEMAHIIMKKCYDEFRRRYGANHDKTLNCLNTLADNLSRQDRDAEAVVILRDALARAKRSLGPEHLQTLGCATSLASALSFCDKHDEAQALFEEVLPVLKRLLGHNHSMVLSVTRNYGRSVASDVSRLDEGEAILVHCMETQTRLLGADHPDTINTGGCLAYVQSLKKSLSENEQLKRMRELAGGLAALTAHKVRAEGGRHPGPLSVRRILEAALEILGSDDDDDDDDDDGKEKEG
jgi:hypothetical protein